MKRKKLIAKLEDISSDMENYISDSNLLTALNDFRALQERLDGVIEKLQNEEEDDKDKEEFGETFGEKEEEPGEA